MKIKGMALLLLLCLLVGGKTSVFAAEEQGGASTSVEVNAFTGLAPDADGNFYLYIDGVKATYYSGLYNDATYGWRMIDHGQVAFYYNEVFGNPRDGGFKITNGAVDFSYSGWFISETEGICYFKNGSLIASSGVGIQLPKDVKDTWTSKEYYTYAKMQPAFTSFSAYLSMLAYVEAEESLRHVDRRLLQNKTIACVGDSITWGMSLNYPAVMQSHLPGVQTLNYGICGGTISSVGKDSMVRNYPKLPPRTNVIILFAGVNDWFQGAPLGSLEDCQPGSFYGDLDTVLTNLQVNYPAAQIVVCTPLDHCETIGFAAQYRVPMEQYAEAMIALAERHGLPVIDLFHSGYLNSCDGQIRANWMMDNIHPNEVGYTFLGTYLAAQLLQILQ
ncbi:MAG: SGNH/GDSL hydrolase family protein [Lachnospiraceae bacterium]|nr:SGNH/GDSL hydrolase family protein [Lachnospiraceae bacterium]